MKAVIVSDARVTNLNVPAGDEFRYQMYGNDGLLHEDTVTLRTARVFAAELKGSSAFMAMIVAIARADPRRYEALVGKVFID